MNKKRKLPRKVKSLLKPEKTEDMILEILRRRREPAMINDLLIELYELYEKVFPERKVLATLLSVMTTKKLITRVGVGLYQIAGKENEQV